MFRKKGLVKNERGATAIEFALVAPLFIAFVLAIFDVGVYFYVASQLQHGVNQAARQIRTGNIIGNNNTARNNFRQAVCDRILTTLVGNCTDTIRVDVRNFSEYTAVDVPTLATMDANGDGIITDDETTFDTGGASCPIVARVFFNYHTVIPQLARVMAAVVPNTSYITAATAFQNEPFTGGTTLRCP